MRYAARRDSNESALLASVEPLGGLWLPGPPFDGWLWDRRAWHLVEVKDPRKEGWRDEFTEAQRLLMTRLKERQVPFHILRTDSDVLSLMGARQAA